MSNETLAARSVGLRGDWIASITNVAPTAATTLTMAALIGASGLASPLALLIAGAAMLCCAVAYHRLNNWQASAAAPVHWVARGLSPIIGFAVGILVLMTALTSNIGSPKAFSDLVALAVIASFATTIQSQIVDGSRIMFGMGRDKTVPPALGRVGRFRTPVAGLIVMGVIPIVALILYLASSSLQKTIVYIDSTGGLLFAGYYVVISLYSIWYYHPVLFRNIREFLMGLLLPLVGAGTLVYVIVKSLPGTATPVKILALVLFLIGIPLAVASKAITRAPFFFTRRERYSEQAPEPVGSRAS